MTAEIIQFGKPERQMPAHVFDAAIYVKPRAENASVRFMYGDELYEVEFHDGSAERIFVIRYRINVDRVLEIRRPQWRARYGNEDPADRALVAEAMRARKSGGSFDETPFKRAALTSRLDQLLSQREKLDRMIERVEAAIGRVCRG